MAIIDQAKGNSLEDQIRQHWGRYGDWRSADQDQVADLARLFEANGITDLSKLQFKKREYDVPAQEWETEAGTLRALGDKRTTFDVIYDGQDFGFLGDVNRDGSLSRLSKDYRSDGSGPQLTDRGDNGAMLAWSSRGGGNTSFRLVEDESGNVVVAPTWGSSKKETFQDVRGIASIAALAAGAYYATAGGVTGQVATGALQGQGSATTASMLSGKGDVDSTLKAGLSGAATGAAAGGIKGVGQTAGWSPATTRAVTAGANTTLRGGGLRDVGRAALFGAVDGVNVTGSSIVDQAIKSGAKTALSGGDLSDVAQSAAVGGASSWLSSVFKPRRA